MKITLNGFCYKIHEPNESVLTVNVEKALLPFVHIISVTSNFQTDSPDLIGSRPDTPGCFINSFRPTEI